MLPINQQGGAFQNISQAHGESGLRHIMAGEVSIPINYVYRDAGVAPPGLRSIFSLSILLQRNSLRS